ncbi:MAG: hypothetical protein PHG66_05860 [Candidatus Colwellbacteria bacterium]|nr:hypothetical protein [Candidatus Colwellbacteria bacterium]
MDKKENKMAKDKQITLNREEINVLHTVLNEGRENLLKILRTLQMVDANDDDEAKSAMKEIQIIRNIINKIS